MCCVKENQGAFSHGCPLFFQIYFSYLTPCYAYGQLLFKFPLELLLSRIFKFDINVL